MEETYIYMTQHHVLRTTRNCQVHIKTTLEGKPITVNVSVDDAIVDLKSKIQDKMKIGLPPDVQRLVGWLDGVVGQLQDVLKGPMLPSSPPVRSYRRLVLHSTKY